MIKNHCHYKKPLVQIHSIFTIRIFAWPDAIRLREKPTAPTQIRFSEVDTVRNAGSNLVTPSPAELNKNNRVKYLFACELPNALRARCTGVASHAVRRWIIQRFWME